MSTIERPVGHNFRWVICALLFFATTINYIDRTVISVLEPELRKIIGWSDVQWSYISASFMLAYAIGFLFSGWMMDRLGTRLGLRSHLSCGRWRRPLMRLQEMLLNS